MRRLFFALPALCNWPKNTPEGRILKPENRHLTLAFLGNCDWTKLKASLQQFFLNRKIGSASLFTECLFLPEKHPHVVSWKVKENSSFFSSITKELNCYLQKENYAFDPKPFLPHVTVARFPFQITPWKQSFQSLGVIFQELHLYESLGYSEYRSLWHISFYSPFEEISHIADRGFLLRGESIQEIYEHAKIALFFDEPLYLPYLTCKKVDSLEETIIALNELISICDEKIGCPYKAVSFTGELKKISTYLTWEMIVDV